MAGNPNYRRFTASEKVAFTTYNNIVLVDPNTVVDAEGNARERLVQHENLVMYANLQANILPRTKLAVGENFDEKSDLIQVANFGGTEDGKINFLKPQGKNYLDTSWTDQFTGQRQDDGAGINQSQVTSFETGKRAIRNSQDTQLLGITNIKINNNSSFIPVVDIEMVDIQGRTLFEQGENSPYSAFMQMPYPLFYLTVKGYYGKAVKYELMLKSFNARFDPSDGNYKLSLSFIGRTAAILSDLPLGALFALPHMYETIFEERENDGVSDYNGDVTTRETRNVQTQNALDSSGTEQYETYNRITTTRGMQKIHQTYQYYKGLGLVDENLPELTLSQLAYRLDAIETFITNTMSEVDLRSINDIKTYRQTLEIFRSYVAINVPASWFRNYLDPSSAIVLNDGKVLYTFNAETDETQEKIDAKAELKAKFKKYSEELRNNETFGTNGTYTVLGKEQSSALSFDVNYDMLIPDSLTLDDIDFEKTFIRQKNFVPNQSDLNTFKTQFAVNFELGEDYVNAELELIQGDVTFYFFGENNDSPTYFNGSFLSKMDILEQQFNVMSERIEKELSEALAEKIEDPQTGLGFKPTIRNVVAILMANVDAFYRLMDDIHREAWDLKDNPQRLRVIVDPEKGDGVDTKDMVQNGNVLNENSFVYPWPQYFQKEYDDQNNQRYVVRYIGDPKLRNRTRAYDYSLWPEVGFLENYIKGQLQREEMPPPLTNNNQKKIANYIPVSAMEYPLLLRAYPDLNEITFLYEIWERTYLQSNYSNLFRPTQSSQNLYNVLGRFEAKTIKDAISSDPFLMMKLKNLGLNSQNFLSLLRSVSGNGQGQRWALFERDLYTSTAVKSLIDTQNGIYKFSDDDVNRIQSEPADESQDNLKEYIVSPLTNELTFTDVYPYTNLTWITNNFSSGVDYNSLEKANSTTNNMFFIETLKMLASFNPDNAENGYDYSPVLPDDWFNFNSLKIEGLTKETFRVESIDMMVNNEYGVTEGNVDYGPNYSGNTNRIQPLSLLNTPYFINAISEGVDNETNGVADPYKNLSYIFLNSLPVSILTEKFNNTGDATVESSFIGNTFNKFAAIHKVPYAFILKYGSIWHRYKTYIQTGVDMLDSVWTSINEDSLYDPLNGQKTSFYNITDYQGSAFTYTMNFTIPQFGVFNPSNISNVGFYPKIINDVTKLVGYNPPFPNYSQTEITNAQQGTIDLGGDGLKIGKNNNSTVTFPVGKVTNDLTTSYSIQNWYTYYDNIDTGEQENYQKCLVYPSVGGLGFSQYGYEKKNNNGVVNGNPLDQTLYDGSVKALWGLSHYGYFDHSNVQKPSYDEYIKIINTNSDTQNQFNLSHQAEYSTIEDLFGVFTKEELDTFEREFLKFSQAVPDSGDPVSVSPGVPSPSIFPSFRNIKGMMKNLFLIDQPVLTGNEDEDGKSIAEKQLLYFNRKIYGFIAQKWLIKRGNPSRFDRKIWNSFSNDINYRPVDAFNYGTYVVGTLPDTTGAINLQQSITNNPAAWEAMYLYVGQYRAQGMVYSNSGSYLTDFFIDNNIEFTEDNVIKLHRLIQMYGSKKMEDNTYDGTQFMSDFNNYLQTLNKYQSNIQNILFRTLNQDLPNLTESQENKRTALDSDIAKLELWETFKVLNDKWIAGGDFQNRTLFEDFLFLDRANLNIGDKVIVDVTSLAGYLNAKNDKNSIYSILGFLLQNNNFIFMALPSYYNFYGITQPSLTASPQDTESPGQETFGTFTEIDTAETRPRFVCMYTDKLSEHSDQSQNIDYRFKSDSFQIERPGSPLEENQEGKTDYSLSNKVVAFNVDFGVRNQNIFQSISLDQAQYKDTSESFAILTDMANQAKGQKAIQQSTSLFNIYKNRSYSAQIVSMGNMMIQPTMYFNLRYVPMFTGPYWITNVAHSIQPGNFTTTFEGVRVSKYSFPQVDKLVMSVNIDILRRQAEKNRRAALTTPNPETEGAEVTEVTETNNQSQSTTGITQNVGILENTDEGGEGRCQGQTKYPNLPYLTIEKEFVSFEDVKNHLNSKTSNNDVITVCFGIPWIEQKANGESGFNSFNGNMIGLRSDLTWSQSVSNKFIGQACLRRGDGQGYLSYASFSSSTVSVDILFDRFSSLTQRINQFKGYYGTSGDGLSKAYAATWLGHWNTGLGYRDGGFQRVIDYANGEGKDSFDYAVGIYKSAINELKP